MIVLESCCAIYLKKSTSKAIKIMNRIAFEEGQKILNQLPPLTLRCVFVLREFLSEERKMFPDICGVFDVHNAVITTTRSAVLRLNKKICDKIYGLYN